MEETGKISHTQSLKGYDRTRIKRIGLEEYLRELKWEKENARRLADSDARPGDTGRSTLLTSQNPNTVFSSKYPVYNRLGRELCVLYQIHEGDVSNELHRVRNGVHGRRSGVRLSTELSFAADFDAVESTNPSLQRAGDGDFRITDDWRAGNSRLPSCSSTATTSVPTTRCSPRPSVFSIYRETTGSESRGRCTERSTPRGTILSADAPLSEGCVWERKRKRVSYALNEETKSTPILRVEATRHLSSPPCAVVAREGGLDDVVIPERQAAPETRRAFHSSAAVEHSSPSVAPPTQTTLYPASQIMPAAYGPNASAVRVQGSLACDMEKNLEDACRRLLGSSALVTHCGGGHTLGEVGGAELHDSGTGKMPALKTGVTFLLAGEEFIVCACIDNGHVFKVSRVGDTSDPQDILLYKWYMRLHADGAEGEASNGMRSESIRAALGLHWCAPEVSVQGYTFDDGGLTLLYLPAKYKSVPISALRLSEMSYKCIVRAVLKALSMLLARRTVHGALNDLRNIYVAFPCDKDSHCSDVPNALPLVVPLHWENSVDFTMFFDRNVGRSVPLLLEVSPPDGSGGAERTRGTRVEMRCGSDVRCALHELLEKDASREMSSEAFYISQKLLLRAEDPASTVPQLVLDVNQLVCALSGGAEEEHRNALWAEHRNALHNLFEK